MKCRLLKNYSKRDRSLIVGFIILCIAMVGVILVLVDV